MAIEFNPSVGQVLVCDYGDYDAANHPDGHLKPEMVKNRLVVVMNAKHARSCVVVPLSTTWNEQEARRGYHVEVEEGALPNILKFSRQTRWAKANMIETVSKLRLDRALSAKGHKFVYLDPLIVEKIQRATIKVIGANSLLQVQPVTLPVSTQGDTAQPESVD